MKCWCHSFLPSMDVILCIILSLSLSYSPLLAPRPPPLPRELTIFYYIIQNITNITTTIVNDVHPIYFAFLSFPLLSVCLPVPPSWLRFCSSSMFFLFLLLWLTLFSFFFFLFLVVSIYLLYLFLLRRRRWKRGESINHHLAGCISGILYGDDGDNGSSS